MLHRAALVAAIFLVGWSGVIFAQTRPSCLSFDDWREAQQYFNEQPSNERLDPNDDGGPVNGLLIPPPPGDLVFFRMTS